MCRDVQRCTEALGRCHRDCVLGSLSEHLVLAKVVADGAGSRPLGWSATPWAGRMTLKAPISSAAESRGDAPFALYANGSAVVTPPDVCLWHGDTMAFWVHRQPHGCLLQGPGANAQEPCRGVVQGAHAHGQRVINIHACMTCMSSDHVLVMGEMRATVWLTPQQLVQVRAR